MSNQSENAGASNGTTENQRDESEIDNDPVSAEINPLGSNNISVVIDSSNPADRKDSYPAAKESVSNGTDVKSRSLRKAIEKAEKLRTPKFLSSLLSIPENAEANFSQGQENNTNKTVTGGADAPNSDNIRRQAREQNSGFETTVNPLFLQTSAEKTQEIMPASPPNPVAKDAAKVSQNQDRGGEEEGQDPFKKKNRNMDGFGGYGSVIRQELPNASATQEAPQELSVSSNDTFDKGLKMGGFGLLVGVGFLAGGPIGAAVVAGIAAAGYKIAQSNNKARIEAEARTNIAENRLARTDRAKTSPNQELGRDRSQDSTELEASQGIENTPSRDGSVASLSNVDPETRKKILAAVKEIVQPADTIMAVRDSSEQDLNPKASATPLNQKSLDLEKNAGKVEIS